MSPFCLFSGVKGVVLDQGKPVAGAAVERIAEWSWSNETVTDEAQTDASGEFSFPPLFRRSILGSFLPHQPVIEQTLKIRYAGKEYLAWAFAKMDYAENSELGGKSIVLACRLESPPEHKGKIYGICDLQ